VSDIQLKCITCWVCIPILHFIYITEDWNITQPIFGSFFWNNKSLGKIWITFHPGGHQVIRLHERAASWNPLKSVHLVLVSSLVRFIGSRRPLCSFCVRVEKSHYREGLLGFTGPVILSDCREQPWINHHNVLFITSQLWGPQQHTHTLTPAHTHTHTPARTHTHTHRHTHTHTWMNINIQYKHTYLHMYVHTHTDILAERQTGILTWTHTHTETGINIHGCISTDNL
jgi:hypothetical protein